MLFLTSCQVKESDGGSGLISGHAPSTNSFTVHTPTAKTYITGDNLDIVLSFPWDVTVTGLPQLSLTIGSTGRNAVYQGGDGTKNLTFRYTIVAADNDNNGVALNSLSLNGGTLQFDSNGVMTNCNVASVTSRVFTNVLVDNNGPSITNAVFTNTPQYYRVGSDITAVITFDEPVVVTGTPRLRMTIQTGGPVYADYVSGSGSSSLIFSYRVTSSTRHTTGNINVDSSLDLNGGTLKDTSGNDANLALGTREATLESSSSTFRFNGRMPYVQNIIVPTPKVYVSGETLEFVLEFDRSVTVNTTGGTPTLPVVIGTNTRQVPYLPGSSTATSLVFRYTAVPGDVDTDGITIAPPSQLVMNGGTITATSGGENFVNTFGAFPNQTLVFPSMTSIRIGANQPAIQSVTIAPDTSGAYAANSTPDNYFKIGEDILITLNFNDNMTVVQTNGVPRIPITVGVATRYATYLSGGDGQTSLIFKYIVQEGDEDTDGITLAPNLDLNGGTITNAALTNTLTTIPTTSFPNRMVDGIRPVISSVGSPAAGTYSTITSPVVKNLLNFNVTWSESVRTSASGSRFPITIDATSRNATSPATDTTGTIITHSYTIVAGDTSDTDGITMSSPMSVTGTVYDSHGNAPSVLTFTPTPMPTVLVDRIAPTITGVVGPAAGRYVTGNNLDFVVTFSEVVDVLKVGIEPRFRLTIGANTRDVVVVSSGSSATHTFRYTVQASDTATGDPTYSTTTLTTAGGSYIRDLGANPSSLTFTAVAPSLAGIVIDEVAPTVSSASTIARTYVSAADGSNSIILTVNYSEPVTISGGTPSITLDIGTGDKEADYDLGTSTSTSLKFIYNIDDTTDMDLDGLALGVTTINTNGATIEDANQNAANRTIGTVTNLSTCYIAPHAVVWVKPTSNNTNRSGFTSRPTVSHTPTYSSNYLNFSGGGSFTISSSVSAEMVYMTLRAPTAVATYPQDLFGGEIQLSSATIDASTMTTVDVRSTSYTGSGTIHNSFLTPNGLTKMELTFPGTTLSGNFIQSGGNQFTGSIRELLIFRSGLSSTQKNYIYGYLTP